MDHLRNVIMMTRWQSYVTLTVVCTSCLLHRHRMFEPSIDPGTTRKSQFSVSCIHHGRVFSHLRHENQQATLFHNLASFFNLFMQNDYAGSTVLLLVWRHRMQNSIFSTNFEGPGS